MMTPVGQRIIRAQNLRGNVLLYFLTKTRNKQRRFNFRGQSKRVCIYLFLGAHHEPEELLMGMAASRPEVLTEGKRLDHLAN